MANASLMANFTAAHRGGTLRSRLERGKFVVYAATKLPSFIIHAG
jgi:hypothetical protein